MIVGPNDIAIRYDRYLIKGYRFHTKRCEINRKSQNNGVVVCAQAEIYSTARDLISMQRIVEYNSMIEATELDYCRFEVCILQNWFGLTNHSSGINMDEYGFAFVITKRFLALNEP